MGAVSGGHLRSRGCTAGAVQSSDDALRRSVYRSKMSWQLPDLRFREFSRSSVVFVDHAAEQLPALYRRLERHDGGLVVIGWPLVPRLVWPVPVVMPGVGPQHSP